MSTLRAAWAWLTHTHDWRLVEGLEVYRQDRLVGYLLVHRCHACGRCYSVEAQLP